jgi:hypothetical protein
VEPGGVLDPLPLDRERITPLLTVAVQQAAADSLARAGGDRRRRQDLPLAVVWTHGADSLLVLLDTLRVATGEGLVTVAVDVACDELVAPDPQTGGQGPGRATIEVDLVVGTSERPTGMLAATTLPRGPRFVVERWSEALAALAWQGMLDASVGIAAAAGHDTDGTPLVPTTWTASREGLQIGPQARHPFDRSAAGVATP